VPAKFLSVNFGSFGLASASGSQGKVALASCDCFRVVKVKLLCHIGDYQKIDVALVFIVMRRLMLAKLSVSMLSGFDFD